MVAFDLQTRNPDTGEVQIVREPFDPRTVGIVVVDLWNFHWCKTSAERVGCLVPRMNRTLALARDAGMRVFFCPTDVADNYVGFPQYEAAQVIPLREVPRAPAREFPHPRDGGGCTCGTEEAGRCQVNFGWDGMNPALFIDARDLILDGPDTLYSACAAHGLTTLLYMGVHTQACLLWKSIGMAEMLRTGLRCILARDLTDAHGLYNPDAGVTPDDFTNEVVAHFERYLSPTINLVDTWRTAGLWQDNWVVDPVRLSPWGTVERPHLFEESVVVTLTAPWQGDVELYYTLDGGVPTPHAIRYTRPFMLTETTHIRAAAFRAGVPVCLPTDGFVARLGTPPQMPDVHLSDLTPLRATGPGHSYGEQTRWTPNVNPPQPDRSNRGLSLRLRHVEYERGMGVHAPNALVYALRTDYARFVGLAGVDEHIVDQNLGSNLAQYPSVLFRVVIDGVVHAESPVMRILEQPWRFDVVIPPGSERISLVAMDGGNGNREDSQTG